MTEVQQGETDLAGACGIIVTRTAQALGASHGVLSEADH